VVEPKPEINAKVLEILKDTDTKEWLDTLESESVKMNYPKHLAEYLLHRKLTIKQMVSNFKRNQSRETKRLQEFVNQLLKKLAPGSVANYVSAIKNRLQYDSVQLSKIRIPNRHVHPTIAEETVPTKDLIISFLSHANLSAQVIIALISFLGVRFHVMAGLKISDFPELKIVDKKVEFGKMPTLVKIRLELSKNKKAYLTFLIEFGCNILKRWLEYRLRQGESLTANSLIMPVETERTFTKQASVIARRLYTVFEKVDYKSRPYSLKNFFATALMNSGIQQNFQTFFMGHTGPVQNTYSVGRQLPQEQIENMRHLFKEKIEPYLIPYDTHADIAVKHAFKKYAEDIGLKVEDAAPVEATIAEIAQVYTAAKQDLTKRTNGKQKRIKERELDKYLDKGWELHTTLPSGDLVVKC